MAWDLAGTKLDANSPLLLDMPSNYITSQEQRYLIRGGYYIPYFDPHAGGDETIIRERLNIELCNRIIRESEIRTISRSVAIADKEIDRGMAEYEKIGLSHGRGKGVIVFQNIVNRIRELSQDFLVVHQSNAAKGVVSAAEKDTQDRIKELYEFIMVRHQEIMGIIHRDDGSEDIDGTIREMFSELGKPHRIPLAMIFESRVTKIGKAMAAIDAVSALMITLMERTTGTAKSQVILAFQNYVAHTKKLCGIPSSDHAIFNDVAEQCINLHDETQTYLSQMEYIQLSAERRLAFVTFLQNGFKLIGDMQHLRDERPESVKQYREFAGVWLSTL